MGWIRIPVSIVNDRDRRELVAILASCGLQVRIVSEKETSKSSKKYYVEYRQDKEKAP